MRLKAGKSKAILVDGHSGCPAELAAYRAVGTLYNALMTALVLGLVTRRGEETARDYVFRHFRRQHLEKFLPGLHKLGLADEPPAPACALYHYHSNALGGVKTGYLRESDRKAWVRYPPPRWIWRGTAIAAVPHSVSAAMLHGWHGHNGVSLDRPGLGFVCTGMTVDGMPGLEGYYIEHDRPLEGGRARALRLRHGGDAARRLGEPAQARDRELARGTAAQRTFRAYAVEYLRTMLPTLQELLGADDAQTGARPRGAPGRAAVPRGDGARAGPADRRRARRPPERHATSRAGCRDPRGPGRGGRDGDGQAGRACRAGAPCAS